MSNIADLETSASGEAVDEGTIRPMSNETATTQFRPESAFFDTDRFAWRHLGPRPHDVAEMLRVVGAESLDALMEETIPSAIRTERPLDIPTGRSEHELLGTLRAMADRNEVFRSLIGLGYSNCVTPPVILRNILENPGWYTQYTPYQAEIAQGRLEALINFQTMVADLTGLEVANASLLDEATAAAEAMGMCYTIARGKKPRFFVADDCHPQTIAVLQSRATPLGIELVVDAPDAFPADVQDICGALVQYPTTDGRIECYEQFAERVHATGARLVVATDLLALTLIRPPGDFGADIAIGSSQRFGVPLGYGGPHAAFLSTREAYTRQLPGRLVGVSRDRHGNLAYRLSIQTREQHIKRDKATSNICTAQVLLAIIAGMYAVYHGPEGLRRIAKRVHAQTECLRLALRQAGHDVGDGLVFDTLRVRPKAGTTAGSVLAAARQRRINLRDFGDGSIGISLDETSDEALFCDLLAIFGTSGDPSVLIQEAKLDYPAPFSRQNDYLAHPVFNRYHAEHEMLRYLYRLQQRDLSLATSMIPLGSCTMKLNATSQMIPVTWPEFGQLHPFAPADQARGYAELFEQLEQWLADLTGFAAVSLQPNAGAQGEYSGLLTIRAYHASRDDTQRDVCLIPVSAHGTNPASAVMAGMRVVAVGCDSHGNIDVADLQAKAEQHRDQLAALMVTYPSTHGVFEESIRQVCQIVHDNGGQVYMDGANMNAQVGLCRPGEIGADVCHLNLHKTFCIPHGGGGPGMGPIAVAAHLAPFLPGHPLADCGGSAAIGPVSAAPYGSSSILPISWMYIAAMGREGLTRATQIAILNANYMARRLSDHYPILYSGQNGRVAHEFILDLRAFKKDLNIGPDDIAKRLMDFGFHAPTMSWPVTNTLMVEPTESESREELDRFCDAMIAIRAEIRAIERNEASREDNPLINAPHTAEYVSADDWAHAYSRQQAAYPLPWVRERKFWPAVGRIDNVWGDRHLHCTCPSVEDMQAER